MEFEVEGLKLERCPFCWLQDQDELIQFLHDHKWRAHAMPEAGGFLDQDARWVDAMNVIDATLVEIQREKHELAEARARLEVELEKQRQKYR